jgi:hypothetical protein
MKSIRVLLVMLIICSPLSLVAQDYSTLKDIQLTDSKSCLDAQAKVLECCDYLLKSPCIDNVTDLQATRFLISWMGATPDFTFSFENGFFASLKGDLNLSGRYVASMAKVAIENNITQNTVDLQLKAILKVLEYSELPINKVKISKKLKKYIEARNNGTLKDLIKV